MMVFEIRYPGTWLALDDRDRAWKLGNFLSLLEHQATDAFVSLNLFQVAQTQPRGTVDRDEWEADAELRRAVETDVRQEFGLEEFGGPWEEVREEVERRIMRKRCEAGEVPRSYSFRLPFLHAHSFLYAVDGFGKALSKLGNETDVPPAVHDVLADFQAAFPGITDVRDSAQHLEDRSRGLGRKEKPLKLKPLVNDFINAPGGGVLILGSLSGDRLGYTSASGEHAEIPISMDSARTIQTLFQRILNAFSWHGPSRLLPN
jgi:hypothetical protein